MAEEFTVVECPAQAALDCPPPNGKEKGGKVEPKRGPGRPRLNIDLDDVEELAEEGSTVEDIAKALNCSKSTLLNRKDVRGAYDRGRAKMRVNLRHWQMQAAKNGNVQMLIWLGKQFLDQKDRVEKEETEALEKLDEILGAVKNKAVQPERKTE